MGRSKEGIIDQEFWADIPDYVGLYQVSSLGNVRTFPKLFKRKYNRGVYLKCSSVKSFPTEKGYLRVPLRKNGKLKRHRVHRLVAQVFIPNPEGKPEVNHLNGIKSDNYISNLQWSTTVENLQHAIATGLNPKWAILSAAKLTQDQVLEVVRLLDTTDLKQKDIASMFGVNSSLINSIHLGKTYTRITNRIRRLK